jgi:hypothetical protein
MHHRKNIESELRASGYTIVSMQSETSDPFAWELIARKDEYEITIRERWCAPADR